MSTHLLTPAMAGLLERIQRAQRTPFHALSVADARRAYAVGAEVLDLPRVPLARVENLTLPAADGTPLPARLYADTQQPVPAPLEADVDGVAPACVILAECDPLVDEGLAYADKLRAAGVAVELELHRGLTHDFIKMGRTLKEAPLALDVASHALKKAWST
jgi:acetyl esterase/lipase